MHCRKLWHRRARNLLTCATSGAQAQAESIVAFLSNEGHVKQLKQDKAYNLAFLQEVFQIGPPQIDALFHYAKFQFDCGNYSVAAEFLYHYRRAGTAWQEGWLWQLPAGGC